MACPPADVAATVAQILSHIMEPYIHFCCHDMNIYLAESLLAVYFYLRSVFAPDEACVTVHTTYDLSRLPTVAWREEPRG